MGQTRYSPYHGRKNALRRFLLALVILLSVILCLALVGLFVLPNYIVYTADGPQLVLPLSGQAQPSQEPSPSPSDSADPGFVVDQPSASPSPSPTPRPDLSAFPRRDAPLGLVSLAWEEVPGQGRGGIYDMTPPQAVYAVTADANVRLPYSAAYLAPEWSGLQDPSAGEEDPLVRRCVQLAALGFDELILAPAAPEADPADLAAGCRALRSVLDDLGYQGRLSLVCRRALFTDPLQSELLAAAGQVFDRVYASQEDSWSGLNLLDQLRDYDFRGGAGDIVTVVNAPVNANWSWAVLP